MYTEQNGASLGKACGMTRQPTVSGLTFNIFAKPKKGSVDLLSEREDQRLGNSIQGWSRGASSVHPVFIFN